MYYVFNHNGTFLCKNRSFEGALKEAKEYTYQTGNETTIKYYKRDKGGVK